MVLACENRSRVMRNHLVVRQSKIKSFVAALINLNLLLSVTTILLLLLLPLLPPPQVANVYAQTASSGVTPNDEKSTHVKSAAYRWLDIALEATAREVDRNGARPTVISRTLAVAITAMYDAWAVYDERATATQPGGAARRPARERTDGNKEKAIAYATYRALLDVYPMDTEWLAAQMRAYGYDPNDLSTDATTPQGIGNLAAAAVIAYRQHDGANQLGDEPGSNGKPYSDYTFYRPVNSVDKIIDPNCWQPIAFDDLKNKGKTVTPGFLTPHWYRVKPFALARANQFRPAPPPKVGSDELRKEVEEIVYYNANLSLKQKAIVEFMRDGPRSTGQSGHWLRLSQAVSRRDNYGIDRDVKMYFAVANAAMDAFIAAWEAKRFYDTSRPWTLVRYYYKGQKIEGWGGAGKGVIEMPAEEWHPYSPYSFITPPFPGYVSGHSAVSAACAKTLELFTGSDRFGEIEKRQAGIMTEADFACEKIQMRLGQPPKDARHTCDVALDLSTFSATAEMAGLSRVMGGYHIQADNIAGLDLGRKVATFVYPKIQSYFDGTVKTNDKNQTPGNSAISLKIISALD